MFLKGKLVRPSTTDFIIYISRSKISKNQIELALVYLVLQDPKRAQKINLLFKMKHVM